MFADYQGPKVTPKAAIDEHYRHIKGYAGKVINAELAAAKRPVLSGDALEEAIADVTGRVWRGLANSSVYGKENISRATIAAGETGFNKLLKPVIRNKTKEWMKSRGTLGSPASRDDAYSLSRSEERLPHDLTDYDNRVGRMDTVVDKAPTPAQQAQINERPKVADIVKSIDDEGDPNVKALSEAYADLISSGIDKPTQPQLMRRLAEMGITGAKGGAEVSDRTIRNWVPKLRAAYEKAGFDPKWIKENFPAILAALGIGGAGAGALSRLLAEHRQRAQHSSHVTPVVA